MTVIVAVKDGNCVLVGCDSAATCGFSISERKGVAKAWEFEHGSARFVAGFAGGFAEGNFIRYAFKWPKRFRGESLEAWLHARVQPALLSSMKKRFEDRKDDEGPDWGLLLAAKDESGTFIYKLSKCGDVEESSEDFATLGSGGEAALACLFSLEDQRSSLTSWERAEVAMKVAEKMQGSVRGPFHFIALV